MKIEDGFGAHMVPFSNGNWSPTSERTGITMLFRGDDNQMIFRMGHNFNGWYEYSVPGIRSTWYHIVITSDWIADVADYTYYDYRVVRRFYVNGAMVDEDTDDAFMPNNKYDRPFSLGVRQMGASTDPAYPCTGYFDDVQYYTHALNPGTIAHMYANPGVTGEIELIPDDFETYADTAELSGYWTTASGTVSLETTDVQDGAQALKALMSSAGTVTKTGAYILSLIHISEPTRPY